MESLFFCARAFFFIHTTPLKQCKINIFSVIAVFSNGGASAFSEKLIFFFVVAYVIGMDQ
jgi:hypothetical protein